MAGKFWTDANTEPKRNYRFRVQIGSTDDQFGVIWYAKSADKPKFDQDVLEHDFLNHKFKFPGRIKWSDVTVVLVDAVSPDAMQRTLKILQSSGYRIPNTPSVRGQQDTGTMSKQMAVDALKSVTITQLDANGNWLEEWQLTNAFLKNAEFEKLDYGNEDMSTITLTLAYDYATCQFPLGESITFGSESP